MNKSTSIIWGLLISMISCDDRAASAYLDKTYEGLWAETMWTYKFKKDGTFQFITEGHYDSSEHSGRYMVMDSLILLNPETDWPMLDGVLKTRLKIISPDCIRDFDNNYYCMTPDSINEYIDKGYLFNENVIKMINNLEVARDKKRRVSNFHKADSLEFRIGYNGIIMVNKNEYHCFSLDQAVFEAQRTYLTFLVTEKPFEIYQHDNAGNKLTKVFSEQVQD